MIDNKYLESRVEYNDKAKNAKTTGMKFTTVSGEDI